MVSLWVSERQCLVDCRSSELFGRPESGELALDVIVVRIVGICRWMFIDIDRENNKRLFLRKEDR